jgi:hypothetical protein
MNYLRTIILSLLLCFVFPLISNADQLEDANAAIKNKDFKKAYELLLPLAEENNTEAQTLLGALYINGQGVEIDSNKGMSLIMKAATQGYKPARIQAFKLCMALGDQGDTAAMYNAGYMCLKGWGGEQDSNDCLRWLETAGKMGHENSAKILSKIYTKGMLGIAPDEEKAAYWSKLPAAFAAGVDGIWEASVPGMGGRPMKFTYEFKTDGDILTGTIIGYGGQKSQIKDGIIDGNNFSFTVESKIRGKKNTAHYTGIFIGDTLNLSYATDMGGAKGPDGKTPPPVTIVAERAE